MGTLRSYFKYEPNLPLGQGCGGEESLIRTETLRWSGHTKPYSDQVVQVQVLMHAHSSHMSMSHLGAVEPFPLSIYLHSS
jgi:hypothetical protein